jgi:hypothetical protein
VFSRDATAPPVAASVTCQSATGPLVVPAIPCKDGGALWQIGGPGVGADGWARAGGEFHPTSDLQDPAWLAELRKCTGG